MNKKCLIVTAALCLALAGCSSDSSSDAASSSKNSSSSSSSVSSSSAGDNDSSRTNESTSLEDSTESDSSSQAVPFGQITNDMIPDVSDKCENIAYVYGTNANSYTVVNVGYHVMGDQLGLHLADNEDRKLTLSETDAPFLFNGIAICPCDKKQTEENGSVVTHQTATEGSYFYAELGKPVEVKNNFGGYTDYPVNAVAFDVEYVKDSDDFTFCREGDDITDSEDGFNLGETKETVEKILGKGYEQDGYSFYKGTSRVTNTQVYFIVHYKDTNGLVTVDKVFIIGRESLYDLKGREFEL